MYRTACKTVLHCETPACVRSATPQSDLLGWQAAARQAGPDPAQLLIEQRDTVGHGMSRPDNPVRNARQSPGLSCISGTNGLTTWRRCSRYAPMASGFVRGTIRVLRGSRASDIVRAAQLFASRCTGGHAHGVRHGARRSCSPGHVLALSSRYQAVTRFNSKQVGLEADIEAASAPTAWRTRAKTHLR